MNNIQAFHYQDGDGNPAGGKTWGRGMLINWQNGPLGRGLERKEPNGAFVEDVLKAALGRLQYYQSGKFADSYNDAAISCIESALGYLQERTQDREDREVEGLNKE